MIPLVALLGNLVLVFPLCASSVFAQPAAGTASGSVTLPSGSAPLVPQESGAEAKTAQEKSTASAKPAETPPAKSPETAPSIGPAVTATPEAGPKLPAAKTETSSRPKTETSLAPPQTTTQGAPSSGGGSGSDAASSASGPGLDSQESDPTMPPKITRELVEPSLSGAAPDTASILDTRISLDLRDIGIMDVLRFLAIKANLNLVGGTGVSTAVSILLNDVSIRDAIDIILSSNRLAYNIKGNIMRIMTEEEYKGLYGKEFYDKRETKIVRLQYAAPKNVGGMLEHAKSTVGRIVYDESTGTVVMTDTPEKIAEMEEIIRHEELPTIVRLPPTISAIFDLQYAQAAKISEKLTPSLTKDVGKLYVDERANRLIVSDLPYKIEEIRGLIAAFDTKTREVFIEAKIVQIVLSNRFQGGVDWASVINGHFQQTFPLNLSSFGQMTLGTLTPTATTNADGTTATTFGGTGMILQFLESFGRTKVLSSPQIAVVDGEEAKIMVGSKEAYTTSSVTQSQATTTTAQQITFVDVGVTLRVTPTISSNGFITMKIKPEVSSVTRFLTTAQGDQIPIVESTNAETRVMIRDGATVLIGGLMGTSRIKTRTGIPVLSRIPILGALFRSTDTEAQNSELSILLTPHIMSGDEAFPGTRPSSVAQVTLPQAGENRDEKDSPFSRNSASGARNGTSDAPGVGIPGSDLSAERSTSGQPTGGEKIEQQKKKRSTKGRWNR